MSTIRVAAIQTKNRTIKYTTPFNDALDLVRSNLDDLVDLAEKAKEEGCDIIAFPEDTLGTLQWTAGHEEEAVDFLGGAQVEMLQRLGEAAGRLEMNIICCNDCPDEKGALYNTSILLGSDGTEIGRYRKVQPTLSERSRERGTDFPVFEVPGIGTIGLCICYDMLFPETTRALALAGADIVFDSTLGGAAMASREVSRGAFRTRAAENFIYLVVAWRGGGSMVIDPKGEILAERPGGDEIIYADIDLHGGREAGDALGGLTSDYRARLFRERNPRAYAILVDPEPPALTKLKDVYVPSIKEAARLMNEGLTTGADAFNEADQMLKDGKKDEARKRFEELSESFGTIWIGNSARKRLQEMDEG